MTYPSTDVILVHEPWNPGVSLYFGRDARPPQLEFTDHGATLRAAIDWTPDVPHMQAKVIDQTIIRGARIGLRVARWTLDPDQRCGPGTLCVRLVPDL
jgi:hypothetical protein